MVLIEVGKLLVYLIYSIQSWFFAGRCIKSNSRFFQRDFNCHTHNLCFVNNYFRAAKVRCEYSSAAFGIQAQLICQCLHFNTQFADPQPIYLCPNKIISPFRWLSSPLTSYYLFLFIHLIGNLIHQEDLLSHGDEVYDIIEDQDKKTIRTELLSNDEDNQSSPTTKSLQQTTSLPSDETRIALCRMNVSRNARRQMRFGDQKVVLIEGHYFSFLPLSSRDEPVFLATCTPIAMPETRECVVQGSTNVFTSIHSMDMKFLYIDGM